ncbi:hypothetical protein [Acetobacter sp.]|uniref:hypothetical protein n=1 Tax=Acetobacter sp. TaxID=440 RepID=UPI0039EA30DB
MSDTIGGAPPAPKAYLEAVADQKAGVVNRGPAKRYRFIAERHDGIKALFWVMAHDAGEAADIAAKYCETMRWVSPARMVGQRSAYDRVVAERAGDLGGEGR